jgi:hypothetical protein
MPHGWVAADIALLIRDLLYYESGQNLVLAGGEFLDQLDVGETIGVKGGPTYFGSLSYQLCRRTPTEYHLVLDGDAAPPAGYVVDTNNRLKVNSVTIDGRRFTGQWGTRIPIPAASKDVVVNTEAPPDSLTPVSISDGPRVTDITKDSAIIRWTTNQPVFSKVVYGEESPYTHNVITDYVLATDHVIPLTELIDGTEYHCKVYYSHSEASAEMTFTTSH